MPRRQLIPPDEVGKALSAIRTAAAAHVGTRDYELRMGARADIAVIDADDIRDALRGLPPRTLVVLRGQIVAGANVEQRLFRGEVSALSASLLGTSRLVEIGGEEQ